MGPYTIQGCEDEGGVNDIRSRFNECVSEWNTSALAHGFAAVVFAAQSAEHTFDKVGADATVVVNSADPDGPSDGVGKVVIGSIGGGSHDLDEVDEERSCVAFVVAPLPKFWDHVLPAESVPMTLSSAVSTS